MLLTFDAADTLIQLTEPVPDVYSRYCLHYNLTISPSDISQTLLIAFQNTPDPIYEDFTDGDTAETAWWKSMVATTLSTAGAADFVKSPNFTLFFDDLFAHYAKADAWALYPDTLSALDLAKSTGHQLAVISNFDNRLFPILENLGLTPYFDLIYNSALARCRKPSADIFRKALTKLEVSPQNCCHVGDSHKKDIAGASAAGIKSYHLTRPEKTLHDFLDSL